MATLTETAQIARKAIVGFGIFVVLVMIGTAAWALSPKPVEPEDIIPTPTPETKYGKLPPVSFPAGAAYPQQFRLETIEGGPPVSTESAYVYFVPKKAPNVFSRRNAVTFASNLEFTNEPQELSETELQFQKSDNADTLTVDSASNNFLFEKDIRTVRTPDDTESQSTLPADEVLVSLARDYFRSLIVFNPELTRTHISYFEIANNQLVPTENRFTAQAARVNFFRSNIGTAPVVTASITESDTYIIFTTFRQRIDQVITASYQDFQPNLMSQSSYPTITGTQAWEKLMSGGGYIASSPGGTVTVREGYMGYYQEYGYQPYLQPVYVFEGDGGFTGMVPAIDPLWIGN